MSNRAFIEENAASLAELTQLVSGLDDRAYQTPTGPGWTLATSLCHLAFWDQRILYLLREWERNGTIEPATLGGQSLQATNHAVNAIAQAVPAAAAGKLVLESAAAVDTYLTQISDEFIVRLAAAGLERYLRRALHRREHLSKFKEVLAPQSRA